MPLDSHTRLGPYEILSPIGAGGMGQVYRARDTRLDRIVAIKVLSPQFAADPQFRLRFDREAKTIAALTHAHICALFDVGHEGEVAYLVMEYVEGETLAQRLERGSLPLAQGLKIAVEIAEALDAAHRAGVVHRDLKPGNIVLSKSGAKLLDFGLARTRVPFATTSGSMLSTSPANLTIQGAILGTLQYMSPEQLEGQEADNRSDIFAFGAVVYEMLGGRRAFEAKSEASLIGAIMHADPPSLTTLNPVLPAFLDHVVRRCLAKDPAERWQSASDVMRELRWIADAPGQNLSENSALTPRIAAKATNRFFWSAAAIAAIVLAAVAAVVAWRIKPEPAHPVRRFSILLPQGSQLPGNRANIAISPDGKALVYAMTSGVSAFELYVRPLDKLESRAIPGTDESVTSQFSPFFSPDGQWIGFWVNNRLKKIATAGGAPVELCETPVPYGVSWPAGGSILLGRGPDGIWQLPEDGGQPFKRIAVDPKKEIAFGPQLLADGKTVLFTLASQQTGNATSMWDDADIVVQALDSQDRTVVIHGGSDARYLSTGSLVFVRRGTLFVVPFDQNRKAVVGSPVPVLEGVEGAGQGYLIGFGGTAVGSMFAISDNGLLIYVPAREVERRTLVWVDRQGREIPLPVPPRGYAYPRISPDGTRIALDIRDQQQGVWIWDLRRQVLSRMTLSAMPDFSPLWTRDGRRVAFSRQGQGIFLKSPDGGGSEDRLTETGNDVHIPNSFSNDGTRLIFNNHHSKGYDLAVINIGDKRTTDLVAQPLVDELNGDVSPDGRWLAYQSNESGRTEIYVRPYPDVQTGRWQVSQAGGTRPRWSATGRELFFLAGQGTMMTTPVDGSSVFRAGNPTKLFSGQYFSALTNRTYDVSADGQRFLMIKAADPTASPSQIVVVENWFQELKRLAPPAR